MTDPVAKLSHNIFGKSLGNDWGASVSGLKSKWGGKKQLLPPGAEGSIFEAAVNLGLKATRGGAALAKTFDQGIGGSQKPFDFEEKGRAKPPFKKAFGFGANLQLADAKRSINLENVRTIIKKAYNQKPPLKGLPMPSGLGFIPNFGDISNILDAVESSRLGSMGGGQGPVDALIKKQYNTSRWNLPGFRVGDYPDWRSLAMSTAKNMDVNLTKDQLSTIENQWVGVFGHPDQSYGGKRGQYIFRKNELAMDASRALSLFEGGRAGRGTLSNELTHVIQDRF